MAETRLRIKHDLFRGFFIEKQITRKVQKKHALSWMYTKWEDQSDWVQIPYHTTRGLFAMDNLHPFQVLHLAVEYARKLMGESKYYYSDNDFNSGPEEIKNN